MELDDLRRRWQQPAAASEPTLTHQKLEAMLASQPDTPLSEMTRHARREQRLVLMVIIFNVANFTNLSRRHFQGNTLVLLDVVVALMILFISWYAYRQRKIIRQLQVGDGSTYGHIRQSIRQLRTLMRNKGYGGMAFLTTIVLTVVYSQQAVILANLRAGTIDWVPTLALALALVALVVGLLYHERWQQQQRYGRYLDQLEATLRELETVER
ncbi:hypothetical protein [Hymenobacter guriensis]|uniref:DUF2721 domain-containing protein n=1 Tax=Hymenobacter guriensis TaxID=2793065 RepID=A0ABS0KWM5_9BACT|nr:hypothetical protein [Hymenobacter guriensis]MBG8552278.1 hypothetical protein [Hymenobacter guriensis]